MPRIRDHRPPATSRLRRAPVPQLLEPAHADREFTWWVRVRRKLGFHGFGRDAKRDPLLLDAERVHDGSSRRSYSCRSAAVRCKSGRQAVAVSGLPRASVDVPNRSYRSYIARSISTLVTGTAVAARPIYATDVVGWGVVEHPHPRSFRVCSGSCLVERAQPGRTGTVTLVTHLRLVRQRWRYGSRRPRRK